MREFITGVLGRRYSRRCRPDGERASDHNATVSRSRSCAGEIIVGEVNAPSQDEVMRRIQRSRRAGSVVAGRARSCAMFF
jgi:hypothetical protein